MGTKRFIAAEDAHSRHQNFAVGRYEYEWQRDYFAAVLETDNDKLAIRLDVAKASLLSRVARLNSDRDEAKTERASIAAALIGLRRLKAERSDGSSLSGEWSL